MDGLLHSLADAVCGLAMLVIACAAVPLLLKLFLPSVGDPLWRAYWWLVGWLLMAPFRLLAYLVREARRH